jgi:hypothetical protein
MAKAQDPQKKDLLSPLLKKVLIHDRRTVGIWSESPQMPYLPRGISKCQVWGPVLTVALTPRGLLNRESESFGGVL